MTFSTDDFDQWAGKKDPNYVSGASAANTDGMPTFARLRLQEHVKKQKSAFTSNLTVNELLLMHTQGCKPVAQVQGSCVYHVGWQYMGSLWSYGGQELSVISNAYADAWRLSVNRLTQQANVAGCHTVVGAELKNTSLDAHVSEAQYKAPQIIEVTLTGSAVRFEGEPVESGALVTTLSGLEYTTLRATGYYPVGIVYGCCVYYQPTYWMCSYDNSGYYGPYPLMMNAEQTDYTQGLMDARAIAEQRMNDQAASLGASGILDTKIRCAISPLEKEAHASVSTNSFGGYGNNFGPNTGSVLGNVIAEVVVDAGSGLLGGNNYNNDYNTGFGTNYGYGYNQPREDVKMWAAIIVFECYGTAVVQVDEGAALHVHKVVEAADAPAPG
jgi:uncharacterized protein YbjQ (UPF0145 family)